LRRFRLLSACGRLEVSLLFPAVFIEYQADGDNHHDEADNLGLMQAEQERGAVPDKIDSESPGPVKEQVDIKQCTFFFEMSP
jgi:hypothetical protein